MKRILTIFILLAFVTCGALCVCAAAEQVEAATEATTIHRTFRTEPLPASDEVQQLRKETQIFSVLGIILGVLIFAAVVWIAVMCNKNRRIKSEIREMQFFLYGYSKGILPADLTVSLGIAILEICTTLLFVLVGLNGLLFQGDPVVVFMNLIIAGALFLHGNAYLSVLGLILAMVGVKHKEHRTVAIVLCIWHGLHLLSLVVDWFRFV